MDKYKLVDYSFNQGIYDIRGITLYQYKDIMTDGSMLFDSRTVNVIGCEIKPLEEEMYNRNIAPLVSKNNLIDVIQEKNEITNWYSEPLYGFYLYRTESKYIVLADKYHNIYNDWEEPRAFYYDNMIYFFDEIPDESDGGYTYNGNLMFIGGAMVCQVPKDVIKNIIKLNGFYDTLPEIKKDLIASEFDVQTLKPSGKIAGTNNF